MTPRESIEAVRQEALVIHKRLIDDARLRYEAAHGAVVRPGEMLRLVAFDPEFAWLRPLTHLILDIDDRLEHETLSAEDVAAVRTGLETIFGPLKPESDMPRA
jgi:hypothetical protein